MVMSRLFHTIGFATTHVVVCKTLYHLKDSHCIGENKKFTDGVECGASIHCIVLYILFTEDNYKL